MCDHQQTRFERVAKQTMRDRQQTRFERVAGSVLGIGCLLLLGLFALFVMGSIAAFCVAVLRLVW